MVCFEVSIDYDIHSFKKGLENSKGIIRVLLTSFQKLRETARLERVYLEFPELWMMMHKKLNDSDQENELKEVFRVFGKDETGEAENSLTFFSFSLFLL